MKEDIMKKFSKLDIEWKITLIIPAVFISTVIINLIIVSNTVIPVAKDSDWIGYYGSVVSGIISIFGIWLTIGYYKEQDRKERAEQHRKELEERKKEKEKYDKEKKRFREKQELDRLRDLMIERLRVKPFLHAQEVKSLENSQKPNVLMHDMHGIYINEEDWETKYFEILNTGIGPAVDLEICFSKDNSIDNKNNFNIILSKEKKIIEFRIHKSNYCFEERVGKLYQGAIRIGFKDIHENYYEFEMKFQDLYSDNYGVDIYKNSQVYIEKF